MKNSRNQESRAASVLYQEQWHQDTMTTKNKSNIVIPLMIFPRPLSAQLELRKDPDILLISAE
jgi:hypothetical protein